MSGFLLFIWIFTSNCSFTNVTLDNREQIHLRGIFMKNLYIKQKVFSLGEKFTIKNEAEEDVYFVEGSFMQIPKTFTISNNRRDVVGVITKKVFSFLPRFFVEVGGEEVLTIRKEFSFLRPKYSIDATGISVEGNWWEMNFKILSNGEVVGEVRKEWFTWGDSYVVQIMDESMEQVIISLVIAIDCVKADNGAATAAH